SLHFVSGIRADHTIGGNSGPTRQALFEVSPNAEQLIVGKWEADGPGKGSVIEFTKSGKLKIAVQKAVVVEGTYRFLTPSRVEIALDQGGGKQQVILTIKRLDATQFTAN